VADDPTEEELLEELRELEAADARGALTTTEQFNRMTELQEAFWGT
jgi:hypothetical protein